MRRLLMMLQDFFLRFVWRARAGARISLFAFFTPGCRFGRNTRVERMCVLHDVAMGDYSYIGDGSRAIRAEIGKFCSIAGSVQIGLGNHPSGMVSTSPVFYTNHNAVRTQWVQHPPEFEEYKQTVIGNDVWVGTRAMIRDGVTIGHGAIIGAGAVVTKDVEPYAVMAGVPARMIRRRFDDETIEKLLKLSWWDWPDDEIRKNTGLFADTAVLLERFSGNRQ